MSINWLDPLGLFSSGGSSSAVTTTTTNVDNRQVVGDGGIAIAGSSGAAVNTGTQASGAATVSQLDAGAIQAALALAVGVLDNAKGVTEQAYQIQEMQGVQLSSAYTDARGTKDVLVIGALLIGGGLLVLLLKR